MLSTGRSRCAAVGTAAVAAQAAASRPIALRPTSRPVPNLFVANLRISLLIPVPPLVNQLPVLGNPSGLCSLDSRGEVCFELFLDEGGYALDSTTTRYIARMR